MRARTLDAIVPIVTFVTLVAAIARDGFAQYRHQPVVPGTGKAVKGGGDDFEDPAWEFVHNFPKSTRELNGWVNEPTGYSKNGYWHESAKRGQPDTVKRVKPPAGGIPGSEGALLMATLHSSIPGYTEREGKQDDLLFNALRVAPDGIPVSRRPSIVVRVYLPPFDEWENRTATSFGFRAAVEALAWREKRTFLIKRKVEKRDIYFPGIFIQFNSNNSSFGGKDSAVFIIRGGDDGEDYVGPEITQTGWWTLGMSFTPDGRCHYYASPGVDPLTEEDRIGSNYPQAVRCKRLYTYFFNVCNESDRTRSTEWIIDDPALYVAGP